MALKNQRFFRKSFMKMSFAIILIFVFGIACLHIWFVNNANRLLIDLVTQKSAGELKLELSHVSFNVFSNEVKIDKAIIASTNNVNSTITYKVSFRKAALHTNSLWSLFITRAVEIRKLKLYDPTIEVFNWRKDSISNNLSLGIELGKLYHSVQDVISALKTQSVSIINAKVILTDEADKSRQPLVFSNIHFALENINNLGGLTGKPLDNSNIIFSSSDQDISLTDGIHKLLFKRLIIQQAKSIILDSCTILALPTQISRNSYTIYFKKLALIGVDFDTLYKTNLIKADSAYCETPVSNINLSSASSGSNVVTKGTPDLEKILKVFSGDLDLGFVAVRNADIRVNISRENNRPIANSAKGNFQIKDLRINPDSSKLISIKTFDMIIKGYNLYNADSSSIFSFDSIRFANDKLLLNNFSVHTSSSINKIRNYRNYKMPYFELLDLDWSELIFRQALKAREAVLHYPTINFKKNATVAIPKKTMFFYPNHTLDDFIEIDKLRVLNGNINIQWGINNFLKLQGFNICLLGNNLENYKNVRLQRDIESLFFLNGYLKIDNINARLRNVIFKANDQIHVEEVYLNNNSGGIDSKLNDVLIKNIYTETDGNIVMDGLQWEHGNIILNSASKEERNNKRSSFLLKNLSGKQTHLQFTNSRVKGDVFIEDAQISSVIHQHNIPMVIKGFKLKGSGIRFSNSSMRINSANCILSDSSQKFLKSMYEYFNKTSTLIINTPLVELTENFNSFFANDLHLNSVLLKSPVIRFHKQNTSGKTVSKISLFPVIQIDRIAIQEPIVSVQIDQNLFSQNFQLPYSKGSEIKADNIQTGSHGATVGSLDIKTTKAEITKGSEKVLKIDNGIDLKLSKLNMSLSGDSLIWNAIVNKLNVKNSDGFAFKIKENNLELGDLSFGNCVVSSSTVNDFGKLIMSNPSVSISTASAKYYSKKALLQCFNVNYFAGQNLLNLDSFNYYPSKPRDSVVANNPYQIDYINFNSSKIKLSGFDLIKYFKYDTLMIQKASFLRPSIFVYRDKFPPYLSGIRKKLIVEQIRDISFPVIISRIEISDGNVSYIEKNAKNRLEGNLLLTHLNGSFLNIKNYDIQPADSLSLIFTGNLMKTSFFNLKVNQSYVDSLYGFIMALKIEPTSLNILNPLLTPLSNIKVTYGKLDTFYMYAIGNEDVAYGEMKFYYHDLHVRLLKNGEVSKSTFIKRVTGGFLNTFVLNTNNLEKNGLIYFERLKDRSFFNYMNKIIFSGIATSVGARKNSRYRKNLINDSYIHINPYTIKAEKTNGFLE